MAFWTIEEVADHTGMTVAQVRESRRRKEWPGNLGRMRGRRLVFNADLVQAGPTTPQTTNDPLEAILWTLQGIEKKVAEGLLQLHKDLVAHFTHQTFDQAVRLAQESTTTQGDQEE